MKYTEIVRNRLWAGNIQAVNHIPELKLCGLETVVSVLPIGHLRAEDSAVAIRKHLIGIQHRTIVSGDYDRLPPDYIAHALIHSGPTLIHCNAGRNRSVAIAACWLVMYESMLWTHAIDRASLARDGKVTEEMKQNVEAFAGWYAARLAAGEGIS